MADSGESSRSSNGGDQEDHYNTRAFFNNVHLSNDTIYGLPRQLPPQPMLFDNFFDPLTPTSAPIPTLNDKRPPLEPYSNISTNNNNTAGTRKPKKRSRASKRAPTTVLSTDTGNFRAMVQEFTGIPGHFVAPAPFHRRSRLDLHLNLNLFGSPPSPFVHQKIIQTPPLSCNSLDALASSTTTTTNINPSQRSSSSLLDANAQHPNILDFQSLSQLVPNYKYLAASSSILPNNKPVDPFLVANQFGVGNNINVDGSAATTIIGFPWPLEDTK